MLILDTFTVLKDGKMKIPTYHRGHLSLMTGTKATIVYLPGQKKNSSLSISELIITPIDFKSWQYLTRINARLINKPGLVRKLLAALAAKDIELLYHAVGPLENGQLLRVEFLVDARLYYNDCQVHRTLKGTKENADFYILSELEIWLKSLLIEYLDWDGGRARLKVRPMESFRNAWETFKEYRDNDDQRSEKGTATINQGSLELPEDICKLIPLATNKILFLSDSKDRMLRGILLNPLDSCTYLRVEHDDETSSSAKITDALSIGFIIFTSLSRVRTQGKRSMIEFMLYSPEYPLLYHEDERKKLVNVLLAKPSLKELDLRISYPPNVGAIGPELLPPNEPEENVAYVPAISALVPLEKELMAESSRKILVDKMNFHHQLTSATDVGVALNSKKLYSACRELLSKLGQQKLDQGIIFVSYPFQFDKLFAILENFLLSLRYKVITGKDIDSGEAYRKDIISRIKSSHGFIGIWKLDENADSIKFSPWLSWELAIAQSCEIPARIFPHENLDLNDPAFKPHRRILPEVNMTPFSDCEFHSYVEDRLRSFQDEVQAFEHKSLQGGPNSFSSTN